MELFHKPSVWQVCIGLEAYITVEHILQIVRMKDKRRETKGKMHGPVPSFSDPIYACFVAKTWVHEKYQNYGTSVWKLGDAVMQKDDYVYITVRLVFEVSHICNVSTIRN